MARRGDLEFLVETACLGEKARKGIKDVKEDQVIADMSKSANCCLCVCVFHS